MKTISKKHNSGQTFETSTFFFPYRRSQWQFSQTDEPSYYLGRNICDSELHVHVHRVPYSFLVCSVPQWSSAVSSEGDNGKHEKLWSQECERPKLPYFEILSPGIRLSRVLLSSERCSARCMSRLYENLKSPYEVCSESRNLKLRSPVLSHRKPTGILLEDREKTKSATTTSNSRDTETLWKWSERKRSQVICLLSIRSALSCLWGFLAWCLRIKI